MLDWIKSHKKTVGTVAAALAAGLSYLGYDPTPLKAVLIALGVQ